MYDSAVMLMEGFYGIMCLQYGWYKMKEASCLYSRKGIALFLTLVVNTVLAPINALCDLFKN